MIDIPSFNTLHVHIYLYRRGLLWWQKTLKLRILEGNHSGSWKETIYLYRWGLSWWQQLGNSDFLKETIQAVSAREPLEVEVPRLFSPRKLPPLKHIYIYIYIHLYLSLSLYIYIYIYIYTHIDPFRLRHVMISEFAWHCYARRILLQCKDMPCHDMYLIDFFVSSWFGFAHRLYSRITICISHLAKQPTRLVSNSAPTGSSRCCFTACHFQFGKSLGRNAIRIEPN